MKIPNESDRISHDHLTIVRKPKAAAGYIEGLKEAILSRNLAVGQRINQRGLTRVRVSNDRKDGKGLPKSTRPALVLVSGDILDVLFPVRDAIADATAIGFQFCFPGPPGPDASTKTGHCCPLSGEPRQKVPQLGQFDLHLSFPCVGASCKNMQNELSAVDYLEIGHLRDYKWDLRSPTHRTLSSEPSLLFQALLRAYQQPLGIQPKKRCAYGCYSDKQREQVGQSHDKKENGKSRVARALKTFEWASIPSPGSFQARHDPHCQSAGDRRKDAAIESMPVPADWLTRHPIAKNIVA